MTKETFNGTIAWITGYKGRVEGRVDKLAVDHE